MVDQYTVNCTGTIYIIEGSETLPPQPFSLTVREGVIKKTRLFSTGMLWNGQFWSRKKRVVADLPDTCISKIYMLVLTTKNTNLHYRKMFLTKKNYSGHAEYVLHFVWKKSTLFSGRGVEPPPLIAEMSAKKSSFFDALPNIKLFFYRKLFFKRFILNILLKNLLTHTKINVF